MSDITIKTNHVPRDLLYWWDLTDKEKSDFDWIENPEESGYDFFRYRGVVYCLDEFVRCHDAFDKQWDGYASDSYFSGVLVKYANDNESVIVATYYS